MSSYFRATVLQNTPLNPTTYILTLNPLEEVSEPVPGQFYMIETGNSYDPLLKRPFSYLRRTPEGIQFLYSVRGKGTLLMRDFRPGKTVNALGPLGNGYPKAGVKTTPVLIAGGTGVASIFSLAAQLPRNAYILYGARCSEDLILLTEVKKLEHKDIVCIDCTDDGSCGMQGTVIDALNTLLSSGPEKITSPLLYACGPKPMLESLSRIAREKGLKGYVSLEEHMACGFGACLGCTVTTVKGNKRVCQEGPVFPIGEIIW
ncbi:MAG: dihydroorotate dehydrogenase electron transfer subunit [Nitrospirota bacterium]